MRGSRVPEVLRGSPRRMTWGDQVVLFFPSLPSRPVLRSLLTSNHRLVDRPSVVRFQFSRWSQGTVA